MLAALIGRKQLQTGQVTVRDIVRNLPSRKSIRSASGGRRPARRLRTYGRSGLFIGTSWVVSLTQRGRARGRMQGARSGVSAIVNQHRCIP